MTFTDFLLKYERYVDIPYCKETSTEYLIYLKDKHLFYHWTPKETYSKGAIYIKRSDWSNGSAGTTIMNGFYDVTSEGKLSKMTGICKEKKVQGQDDFLILSPQPFAGFGLDYINFAWVNDYSDIYDKKGRQKTDNSPKQSAAGIGATKRKREQAVTFVYSVSEVKSISEKSGLPIYAKAINVRVKRVDENAASNYVKSMYSYKKTGKVYFVELVKTEK